jgi:linoleoyl-CoA desaturase
MAKSSVSARGVRPASAQVHAADQGTSKATFGNGGAFLREIRDEVERVVKEDTRRRAARQLYLKAPLAIGLVSLAWLLLLFAQPHGLTVGLCILALAAGGTLIAFCVQHDANHGAYFTSRRFNHLVGWTSDCLLGFSSYAWRVKHNVAHHTYTNVDGYDADIDQGPYLRLAPTQPPRSHYRFQHLYIWALYSLMGLRWQIAGDLSSLRAGSIGKSTLRFPKGWALVGIVAGKTLFIAWALVVPSFFYPWWMVATVYIAINMAASLVMAVTFQLAHCVEEAKFSSAAELSSTPRLWAVHEVESTVGGLNYQIEHHLFPRLPHTLYPAIAPLVRQACHRHGIRYTVHPTLRAALRSHLRHLRQLGQTGVRAELEMG